MSWVAAHSDLHLSGLTPAACRPGALALTSIDLAGRFQLDGHGFDGGEFVRYTTGDPSPPRALPSSIVMGRWYVVAPTNGDPDFYQHAPSVPLSDAGRGPIYVVENYIPKIDRQMAAWTSVLISKAVAYKPPWITPPAWAPMMVAKLAAPSIATILRVSKDRYPVDDLAAGYEWAQKELRFLEAGGIYNDGTGPIDSAAAAGTNDAGRAGGRRSWGFERARCL